ncbi:Vacuolar protein sorting-associated protein [Lachnellula willkommii]|uniref:Vacuolar protein sorting-associated protein n=1 Tax=Lachnellula willkommii TaxID=215461 RepID=A0A559M8M7_9HELO|nr:Vacuolar protein sorting-associated protein [Lachnellula willkommii]
MITFADKMAIKLPDFMASSENKKSDTQRPRTIHASKSFSKLAPASPDPANRIQRANTIQNGLDSPGTMSDKSQASLRKQADAFEKSSEDEEEQGQTDDASGKLPSDFDELPIELVSLTDSFIDSLSAKIHPTPPTVDKLATLFQDFYAVAATHINTHISALSSRQHRESSPSPSMSSLSSTASKIRAKAVSISNNKERPRPPPERNDSEQQMLTADEIADRKRARKVLEYKRVALEEAVERRVCESIYNRIWRHRSTTDEEKDEKLRSKTAALSVVGIGLNDLDVDLGQATEDPVAMQTRETEVREWLEGARDELMAMSDEKYPLGKLHHLKAAHKSIVDTLSHFHPSSSADEIMPMLIYTLITSRPEGIDVISNLHFIQRFRNENKIDGEAAYCLTNLEAAITFLETVDLATLREDEALSGPKANSRPSTPKSNNSMTPAPFTTAGLSPAEVTATSASPTITTTPSSPTGARPSVQHNRRLSDMFQPPAVLGAAGDAVLNTADQGFKSIGNSLEGSYKFLLGKLKERQEESTGKTSDIIVPKTLDDARKLVSTPPPEDDASASGASSLHSPENTRRPRRNSAAKPDDKMLNLIGGRKAAARDRSTDSSRSANSSKKVAFAEEGGEKQPSSPLHPPASPANPAIVESMRNLGNSLNPINRFSNMNMTRGFGFGRPPTTPTTPGNKPIPDGGVADLTSTFPELAPVLPPKEIPKIAPPIKRFMEIQNPGDMKLNEVLELLRDYRRLAGALKDIGAV